MQVYTNSKRQSLKTIFVFLVVLLVAYLPVSTFLFFIKNDAFNGYFPPKFFMSESIHAGYLPLWNPYINYGIPQYGDMSSGFWNPITWVIAATTGYNAYTFTLEVLAYIFIGGLGMYKLTRCFGLQNRVRFIAAIAYMCCGYNVGHLQHFNWLSGAAFLPWCLWGYLLLNEKTDTRNILRASLAFYLFISSAHPGLVIGALYFFIALLLYLFFNNRNLSNINKIKKVLLGNSLLLAALLLLAAGLITGYADILPYFSRGEKVVLAEGLKNPTTVQSWLSALLPLSTVKNESFFATDISMRNIYFSLTLALFLLVSLFQRDRLQKFFLFTGIAFLLLSSGGIFKTFAYQFLPLISYVRLDGEFIIFSVLCFILVAAIQLNRYITESHEFSGTIKWLYYTLEIFLFACIVFGLIKMIGSKTGLLYATGKIMGAGGLSMKLKAGIDALSFYDTLWLEGIIQLMLLWCIKFSIRDKRWNMLVRIVMIDMVIATLLNLPFTGVGKASVAEVQSVLNKAPHGIPLPLLQPITENDTMGVEEKGLVGDWSLYNKQLGVTREVAYPIVLNDSKRYFQMQESHPGFGFTRNNFLFTRDSKATKPVITFFSPDKIAISITAADTGTVIYQQAFYPHWFYYNGEKKEVQQYAGVFIAAPLHKGENAVTITFEPGKVMIAMLVSLLVLMIILILLIINPQCIRRSLFPSSLLTPPGP